MERIDNPKVFISYAWGSNEYQKKVLSFSASLVDVGVEVLLDKWSVIEGNDLNAFMEKCVSDKSVTNVLILLDPVYASKADKKEGGVGTETQIISQKVYESVTQDKFIPIVFERDDEGNVSKPVFLSGRLYFDLTKDNYDEEFKKLVRRLYGVEIYKKPEKGIRPAWVDEQMVIAPQKIYDYGGLKKIHLMS